MASQPRDPVSAAEGQLAYLYGRMREERGSAELAADPPGYRRHTELARTYERQIRLIERSLQRQGCMRGTM
jgi:hypothetical protein